jgi:hypothetical protein
MGVPVCSKFSLMVAEIPSNLHGAGHLVNKVYRSVGTSMRAVLSRIKSGRVFFVESSSFEFGNRELDLERRWSSWLMVLESLAVTSGKEIES